MPGEFFTLPPHAVLLQRGRLLAITLFCGIEDLCDPTKLFTSHASAKKAIVQLHSKRNSQYVQRPNIQKSDCTEEENLEKKVSL